MRFLGNIEAKTDAKGRVFLPAVFRKELVTGGEERLVMRKDVHQRCLVLFPESAWNRRMDEMFRNADEWDELERQAIRQSHNNPQIQELYKKFLGEPNSHLAHELLHTSYAGRPAFRP